MEQYYTHGLNPNSVPANDIESILNAIRLNPQNDESLLIIGR